MSTHIVLILTECNVCSGLASPSLSSICPRSTLWTAGIYTIHISIHSRHAVMISTHSRYAVMISTNIYTQQIRCHDIYKYLHISTHIYTYLHISTISSIISNKNSSKLLRNCLIGILWTGPTDEAYDQCNLSWHRGETSPDLRSCPPVHLVGAWASVTCTGADTDHWILRQHHLQILIIRRLCLSYSVCIK